MNLGRQKHHQRAILSKTKMVNLNNGMKFSKWLVLRESEVPVMFVLVNNDQQDIQFPLGVFHNHAEAETWKQSSSFLKELSQRAESSDWFVSMKVYSPRDISLRWAKLQAREFWNIDQNDSAQELVNASIE